LYSDNQALQFITRKEKLNQRNTKWVGFMNNFTFFIKHIFGNANIIVDALRKICLIVHEFQVNTLAFEHLKDMYCDDIDFKEGYEACTNPVLRDRGKLIECMVHEGLFFKGNQSCIQKFSMKDNHLKEKDSGGLVGHFSHDKTFSQLSSSYYWPGMRT
jgi:hypothetical protein